MKKRFSEEQIIGFLKEADSGVPVKELCHRHGFSDASYYLWRSKFGGMDVSDAKRLKALESENARLEKLTPGTHRWLSSPATASVVITLTRMRDEVCARRGRPALRQRPRTEGQGHADVGASKRRGTAANRTRQTGSGHIRRIVQRPAASTKPGSSAWRTPRP